MAGSGLRTFVSFFGFARHRSRLLQYDTASTPRLPDYYDHRSFWSSPIQAELFRL